MIRKKLFKDLKQFISYFFVGGIAALIEWLMFFLFSNILNIHYQISTILAFIFSTTSNWFLGRKITFRNSKYLLEKQKEFILIFSVSTIGLLLNIILMYIWVSILNMNTGFEKMIGKVVATGIIFFWNFLIRKYVIYKENN